MHRKHYLIVAFLLFMPLGSVLWAAETQYIQVKEAPVRDKASALGKLLGTIPYTTPVIVLEKAGAWARISCSEPKLNGWISQSAITVKNLGLKAGAGGTSSASSNEVALAGKGFNEQVEKEYRSQNSQLDFDWVDKMEAIKVTDEELAVFLSDGPTGAFK